MSNLHKLKENHNWTVDGVTGDVEYAINQLLADLKSGDVSCWKMLYRWDEARGNDWFTQTRKELTEIDLDQVD